MIQHYYQQKKRKKTVVTGRTKYHVYKTTTLENMTHHIHVNLFVHIENIKTNIILYELRTPKLLVINVN
jgi:hypothetical protein